MLERAVGLDPNYAPAWQALGLRYYYDSQYSNGGEDSFQRSNAACERALALDPKLILAAAQLVTNKWSREVDGAADGSHEAIRRARFGAQDQLLLHLAGGFLPWSASMSPAGPPLPQSVCRLAALGQDRKLPR